MSLQCRGTAGGSDSMSKLVVKGLHLPGLRGASGRPLIILDNVPAVVGIYPGFANRKIIIPGLGLWLQMSGTLHANKCALSTGKPLHGDFSKNIYVYRDHHAITCPCN